MEAIEFKEYVETYLNNLARVYGVTNLEKYYTPTDFRLRKINSLSGMEQVFAQYIMHSQNGTMIEGIVSFFKNYDFLKQKLANFNPRAFLTKYHYSQENRDDIVPIIVNDLRYDPATRQGLKWSTDKSEKKDFIMTRFVNSLIDGALYFQKFNNRQEVINDLLSHYDHHNVEPLIKYVMSNFKHGFSVALCCDFLKEFDAAFDFPKPDVHLMEVFAKYQGKELSFYKNGQKGAFNCVNDFVATVNQIKEVDPTMTAYKLDRQIWLCCTGNFFLDDSKNIKSCFLENIN